MRPISVKTLRDADWRPVYKYDGLTVSFVTYGCDALPGLTITHEKRKGDTKAITRYAFNGLKTDTPTQIVRIYNEHARKANGQEGVSAGRPAAVRDEPAQRPGDQGGRL